MDVKNAFLKSLDKKEFENTIEIVSRNSYGKIYLIGSRIYKGAASKLYGTAKPTGDYDFVIEELSKHIILPEGWELHENRFGNPKFTSEKLSIDAVPLKNVNSIKRRELTPTILNYLTGTPLTVQSIAYDIFEDELFGEVGIQAIIDKTVSINNQEEAKIAAQKKEMTLNDYVKKIADSLQFKFVLQE